MMIKRCSCYLILLSLIWGSCEDKEAGFSVEPYIQFKKIEFVEGETGPDSLKLYLNFADQDMDLGLYHTQKERPYHKYFFYILSNEEPRQISSTYAEFLSGNGDLIGGYLINAEGQSGKLVTTRTTNAAGNKYAPPPYTIRACNPFLTGSENIFLSAENSHLIDSTYTIDGTLEFDSAPDLYILTDTLFVSENPDFFNIEVDFFVKQPDGHFEEFDWSGNYCQSFDGRFPYLPSLKKNDYVQEGPFKIRGLSANTGLMEYGMASFGFRVLFGDKTLKLRIKIRDRSLHESNVIETPPFTLTK